MHKETVRIIIDIMDEYVITKVFLTIALHNHYKTV